MGGLIKMYNKLKKLFHANFLIICFIIAFVVLSFALITSFPYINGYALQNKNIYKRINKTFKEEHLTIGLPPAFRFQEYYVELHEKTDIDFIIKPDSKKIKVEVVGAEDIGLAIDSNKLIKEGLKILKPKRPRNSISKREALIESMILRTKAIFDLRKIENKAQTISAIDYKIYKIPLEAILPGSYTIKATVDDKETCTTNILTKPQFRADFINPATIECGGEKIILVSGKGLNTLTQIKIEGTDIKVKNIDVSEENIAKVKLLASGNIEPGFRDVIVSSPLAGVTETLVGALEIKCSTFKTENLPVTQGPQGEKGETGSPGMDGMGICENVKDTLMVFANNLPSGSQSTVFFDPVLCNLTFGIPVGFNGVNGSNGTNGATGTNGTNGLTSLVKVSNEPQGSNCQKGGTKVESGLDLNNNNVLDSNEVTSTSYVCGK